MRQRNTGWVGRTLADRYRVQSLIGTGASAAVYKGERLDGTGDDVALKISRPHILKKRRRAARFIREVQAIQRIDHPSCVRIVDWGIEDEEGCAYIVMELIDGEDLYALIQRAAPLAERNAALIGIGICNVLEAAHNLGVIHRDLKPRNIMILPSIEDTEQPTLKVLDFGLAKLLRSRTNQDDTNPETLTKPGAVLGTPNYMAPEQVRVDGAIDGRADIYALCVMLYEMVTGERALNERNAVRALIAVPTFEPIPPTDHRPELDPAFEHLILKGMSKSPGDRFENVAVLRAALEAILDRSEGDDETLLHVMVDEATLVRRAPSAEDCTDESVSISVNMSTEDSVESLTHIRPKRKGATAQDSLDDEATDAKTTVLHREEKKRNKRAPDLRVKGKEGKKGKAKRAKRATRQQPERLQTVLYVVTVGALVAAAGRWFGVW